MIDLSKARAIGPWILVKPEPQPTMSKGGLHLPVDPVMTRIGYNVAKVISVGEGYWKPTGGKPAFKFRKSELKPGDRVAYRAHLQNACKFDEYSFIHLEDLELGLDESTELDLALPHDN